MEKILVVDDEETILKLLQRILQQDDYAVTVMNSAEEAIKLLSHETFDIALTDLKMPNFSGITLLKEIKRLHPATEVIIMTGEATIESAIEAIKNGAYDYLLKPFNLNDMLATVKKCLDFSRLRRQENVFRETTNLYQLSQDITKTRSEKELLQLILERTVTTLHADSGSIFMITRGKDELTPMASYGLEHALEKDIKFGEKVIGWVAEKRQPLLIQDKLDSLPQFQTITPRTEILSSMVCPLIHQETLLGVMCLNRFSEGTNYQFTTHDLESLKVFALHATFIIAALQHYEAQHQLDELKTEFMANVSHEIRTPLMAISGAVELLFTYLSSTFANEKGRMFLDLIKRNTDRMQFLVNDLLDFSRIETQRLKITPAVFKLKPLVDEIVEDFELKAKEKEISLSGECDDENMELGADRERIKQVLANLVGNSLKFTPEKGMIKIGCNYIEGAKALITVYDNGIGIPKDKQSRIFEKFYQVDGSVGRSHPGFGLGLAIVKSIIEKHAGGIAVESEPGKGSTFLITLPIRFSGEAAT